MDIRQIKTILMLLMTLTCYEDSVATNREQVLLSPVRMPSVMGDPKRSDPLTALASLTGIANSDVCKDGVCHFANNFGPFVQMTVKTVRRGNTRKVPVSIEASAIVPDLAGKRGMEILRQMRDALVFETGNARFAEFILEEGRSVEERSVEGSCFGWAIVLSLAMKDAGAHFELRMVRKVPEQSRQCPVEVEVDI